MSDRVDWIQNIKNRPVLDVRQFGAKCDGVTDDAVAVQAAVNAATQFNCRLIFPTGNCLIGNVINVVIPASNSIWITGQGRDSSYITMKNNGGLHTIFAVSSPGGSYATHGGIAEMSLRQTQPDSVNPADMLHYAPAITLTGTNHFKLSHLNIIGPWIGISASLINGLYMDNISMSPFNTGFSLSRCYDAVVFNCPHMWPHGLTVNQAIAWLDTASQTTAIVSGHVDSFSLVSPTFLTTKLSCYFFKDVDGFGTTGNINGGWFDGFGNIKADACNLTISDLHMGCGGSVISGIDIVGGCAVNINNLTLTAGAITVPIIRFLVTKDTVDVPALGIPSMRISNSYMDLGANDTAATIFSDATAPASNEFDFTMIGNLIHRNPAGSNLNPTLQIANGGGGKIHNILIGNKFGGSPVIGKKAVQWDADNGHTALGNIGLNWGYSSPSWVNNRWIGNSGFNPAGDH
jgi:hypothetical protein